MMKSVLFVALLVALASPSSALPADDVIIPEDIDLLQETAWGDAVERVNSLLAVGKDDKACADLAKSEKKAIQDSVKTNQKLLNELPTGVDCKLEGVDLVETQKKEWFKTHKELAKAKDALEKAGCAEIDFGKRTFLSIASTGACAIEKSDLKYVAAKGVYDAAQKKVVTATAKHKAAIKGYNEAVAAADKQRKECKCDVQKKQADAWKKANAANASNQKGWTQATNMLCVTGGTHYNDCKGSTAPTVKKPYIDNGAKNAQCPTGLGKCGCNWAKLKAYTFGKPKSESWGGCRKGCVTGGKAGSLKHGEESKIGRTDYHFNADLHCLTNSHGHVKNTKQNKQKDIPCTGWYQGVFRRHGSICQASTDEATKEYGWCGTELPPTKTQYGDSVNCNC